MEGHIILCLREEGHENTAGCGQMEKDQEELLDDGRRFTTRGKED